MTMPNTKTKPKSEAKWKEEVFNWGIDELGFATLFIGDLSIGEYAINFIRHLLEEDRKQHDAEIVEKIKGIGAIYCSEVDRYVLDRDFIIQLLEEKK